MKTASNRQRAKHNQAEGKLAKYVVVTGKRVAVISCHGVGCARFSDGERNCTILPVMKM